jgi:hypothetical protein
MIQPPWVQRLGNEDKKKKQNSSSVFEKKNISNMNFANKILLHLACLNAQLINSGFATRSIFPNPDQIYME